MQQPSISNTHTTSHLINSFSIFSTHISSREALFHDSSKSAIIVLTCNFPVGTAHAFNHFLRESTFFSSIDSNKVQGLELL
jgi:hypothetical protein